MPNYVHCKIVLVSTGVEPQRVDPQYIIDSLFVSGGVDEKPHLDFNRLIPTPIHVYHGNIGEAEEKDFPANWYTWNIEHWGTKWNACSSSYEVMLATDNLVIEFSTAWKVPYPVIVAFANQFKIPFELRYCEDGSAFWGIEKWDHPQAPFSGKYLSRVDNRPNFEADKVLLEKEFDIYNEDGEGEVEA